jgi:hypothetical protein
MSPRHMEVRHAPRSRPHRPAGHGTTTAGRRCPITGRAPRTSGLAGVVTVVLATLNAVGAPVPAAGLASRRTLYGSDQRLCALRRGCLRFHNSALEQFGGEMHAAAIGLRSTVFAIIDRPRAGSGACGCVILHRQVGPIRRTVEQWGLARPPSRSCQSGVSSRPMVSSTDQRTNTSRSQSHWVASGSGVRRSGGHDRIAAAASPSFPRVPSGVDTGCERMRRATNCIMHEALILFVLTGTARCAGPAM